MYYIARVLHFQKMKIKKKKARDKINDEISSECNIQYNRFRTLSGVRMIKLFNCNTNISNANSLLQIERLREQNKEMVQRQQELLRNSLQGLLR